MRKAQLKKALAEGTELAVRHRRGDDDDEVMRVRLTAEAGTQAAEALTGEKSAQLWPFEVLDAHRARVDNFKFFWHEYGRGLRPNAPCGKSAQFVSTWAEFEVARKAWQEAAAASLDAAIGAGRARLEKLAEALRGAGIIGPEPFRCTGWHTTITDGPWKLTIVSQKRGDHWLPGYNSKIEVRSDYVRASFSIEEVDRPDVQALLLMVGGECEFEDFPQV